MRNGGHVWGLTDQQGAFSCMWSDWNCTCSQLLDHELQHSAVAAALCAYVNEGSSCRARSYTRMAASCSFWRLSRLPITHHVCGHCIRSTDQGDKDVCQLCCVHCM
jgi:hypothetical protein